MEAYLVGCTNKEGSECETSLDISKEDWDELTAEEQDELVKEYLFDIIDYYVAFK